MKIWPPIVIVPVRDVLGLEATAKTTIPLPVPVAPDVMIIHGVLLTAVQEHPLGAITPILPSLAPLEKALEVGEIEKLQGTPA